MADQHCTIELKRHGFFWVWRYVIVAEDTGYRDVIASGAKFRKLNARMAANAWHRVWLRQHGLL